MKLLLLVTTLLFFVGITSLKVLAHSGTTQPYLILNDKYSMANPIRGSVIKEMDMPGDLAPEKYSVGQKIIFEIDTSKVLLPPDVLTKVTFYWDYGDGGKSEGVKSTHTYKKMGSYILRLSASYMGNKASILDSVLINVLPYRSYKAPIAIIAVQERKIRDSKNDITYVKPGQSISLEAIREPRESSSTYLWDLGDGSSSTQRKLIHTYKNTFSLISPIVKIKDKDGFITYAFANIEFSDTLVNKDTNSNQLLLYFIYGGLGVLVLGGVLLFFKLKGQSNT